MAAPENQAQQRQVAPAVARPSRSQISAAVAVAVFDGGDLSAVRIGQPRTKAASLLGLPAGGLDAAATEVSNAASVVVSALDDWWAPEQADACSSVYLVTLAEILSATVESSDRPLRLLTGITRQHVLDAMLDAVQNPCSDADGKAGRPRTTPVETLKMVVFMEVNTFTWQ